jgi:hypothetical protein
LFIRVPSERVSKTNEAEVKEFGIVVLVAEL